MKKEEFSNLYRQLTTEKRAHVRTLLNKKGIDFSSFPIGSKPVDVIHPNLSFAQYRLWFLDKFESVNNFYNMPMAVRLSGRLDVAAMRRTLNDIVARHEILRTTFAEVDGVAAQIIAPALDLALPLTDLGAVPATEREAQASRLAQDEALAPFDLSTGPLIRAGLIRLAPDDHVILLTMHHIVSDGWSMGILVEEIGALYGAFVQNLPSPLAPLAIQYADFAHWQREWLSGEVLERQLGYWRKQLEQAPALLLLPTDRPRPAMQTYHGAAWQITVPAATTAGLQALGRQAHTTLFMTLAAAFNVLLARYSGQDDICIGTPIANRNRAELEPLIGFFVNTLVLRARVGAKLPFSAFLQQLRATTLEAYAHQDLPFEQLVEALKPERHTSHAPLFQVMLVLNNAPTGVLELPGLSLAPVPTDSVTAKFDLTLNVTQHGDQLFAMFEYNTDLFDAATIERMARHFKGLLDAVAADPSRALGELAMLDAGEQRQLLVEWNDTARAYPQGLCIHQWFEQLAAHMPLQVALDCAGRTLTYAELNGRANRLARHLRAQGVGPEVLVGICVERSIDMVVGLLAVLKAGGAYLPLDPAYPQERLAYMLADSRPALLLAHEHLRAALPDAGVPVLRLDGEGGEWDSLADADHNLPELARPGNLAYVIYTSGSTGQPKGVLLQHAGLGNLVRAQTEAFGVQAGQRVLQFASFNFDASVSEVFMALCSGATLCIATREELLPGAGLEHTLQQQRINVVTLPPVALRALSPACAEALTTLIVAGEACSGGLVSQWGATRRFFNAYGPTEVTVCASIHECDAGQAGAPPIGRPIANTRAYILDAELNPVPVGIAGELHVAGIGLARGYLKRADLSAEKFVPDPFSAHPGGRMYKTGDLVRYLADGNIEFLGRVDQQVKVRGFRIEPGEIEAALMGMPEWQAAAVMVREDQAGDKRLVAYLVPRDPATDVAAGALRAALLRSLPDYMVPAHFVRLAQLPLSPNGKLDTRQLPAPDAARGAGAYVAPRTPTEAALAAIWASVLKVQQVGMHDNFFELGGDSILCIQIIARARQAQLYLTPKELFQNPTVGALAAVVRTSTTVQAEQGLVSGSAGLTPIQHWFFAQQMPAAHHYNQSLILQVLQPLAPALLAQSLQVLTRQHDALRLRFQQRDGTWQADHAEPSDQDLLQTIDLSRLDAPQQTAAIEQYGERLQAGLDLSTGPLLRAIYFQLGEQPGRLMLVCHHLIVDGVSWRVLLEDLQTVYTQLMQGQAPRLGAKSSSWKQWSHRLQEYAGSAALQEERAFWQRQEASAAAPLDVDFPQGDATLASDASATAELSVESTNALLTRVPAAYRTQINDVLLASLACALGDWTAQPCMTIDLEGHGREDLFADLDTSRTIGWFTSTYPLQLQLDRARDYSATLKTVKEQLRAIPRHGIGYGLLRYLSAADHAAAPDAAGAAISFNYFGQVDNALHQSTLFGPASEAHGATRSARHRRHHEVAINAIVSAGQLRLSFSYSGQRFKTETMEALAAHYLRHLHAIIAHCVALPEGAGAYTPSDFALAGLDQPQLDALASEHAIAGALEDIYPLTALQHGILFHTLLAPDSGVYVEQLSCSIAATLNVPVLEQTLQMLVDRHPMLRSAFIWQGVDSPVQLVYRHAAVALTRFDWRQDDLALQQQRIDAFRLQDRQRGFDFTHKSLQRFALIRLHDGSYEFIWTTHHIVSDGWSFSLLLREMLACYDALGKGQAPQLAAPQPYRAYLDWLRQQDEDEAQRYWRQALAGMSAPTPLAVDRNDPQAQGHGQQRWIYDGAGAAAMSAFVRDYGITPNTLVQGVWAILLQRYSQQSDVSFGVVVSGRAPEIDGIETMVGLFINSLPVRVNVDAHAVLGNWLGALQAQNLDMRQFEATSLSQIQNWSAVPAGTPLFDSLVVFENYPIDEAVGRADQVLSIGNVRMVEQTSYPLTIVASHGERLSLEFNYDRQRFDAATIDRMIAHFGRLLDAVVLNPAGRIGELAMLAADERRQLLVDWNDTARPYPQGQTIHQLFEAQAARAPAATALVCGGAALTYAELNAQANRLAHHLRARGVGPDVLVGLCVERCFDMVVGLLAILKAGGAYVPLDPAYPRQRLAYMLEDAAPALLLTQQHLLERLPALALPLLCLDRDWNGLEGDAANPAPLARPEHLAYVIYTSGSTGQPKGVAVSLRNVVRLVCNSDYFTLTAGQRVLQFAPVAFDASTFEIWGALLNGATLVLAPQERLSSAALGGLITAERIDTMWLTAALFNQMVEDQLPALTSVGHLLAGGEALSAHHVRQFLAAAEAAASGARLTNGYGPTEGTTFTCCHLLPDHAEAGASVPIGRPIANTEVYLLDARLRPVPVGVAGELYLSGAGLARGYLNRPELTAEKFLPHPFSATPGARMYRTGDLARYLPDGNIEYLGRIDQQVKLRGFRIELGEIEAALSALPVVREAVVLAREDVAGDKRLVAYLVLAQDHAGEAPDLGALRGELLRTLPEYMIPAHVVLLEQLPLSPNGKLDRKALPAPDMSRGSQDYVAPRTPTEQAVAAIWAEVLKLDRVGVHDNFFERGGHSLLATQLMSKLRGAFAVELPLRTLFEAGSVELLAQRVDQARQEQCGPSAPAIVPVARDGRLPLSFAQQRLWFLDQFESGSSFYNIPAAVRLNGRLDVAAMRGTLNEIVRRHEALRTSFASVDGTPVQVIAPALEVALPLTDLSELPAAEREAKALWLAQDAAQTPFDLAAGPLLRAALIRLAPREHIVVLTLHHIVSDGWSMGVLVAEIAALYGARVQGLPSPLPALAIQYADFAHWQREWLSGEVLERQLGYWRAQLAQAPTLLPLPTDRARPAVQTYHGATLAFTVPAAVTAGLQALGQQVQGTLFMTLAAAFNVLLSRYAGQSDICIGMPIANRNRGELEPLIGFFVNTLVLRAQVDGDMPFTALLAQLRATTLDAYAHQDLPFEQLVDAVKPERHTSHAPLFQVMLSLQNTPMEALELPELSLQPVPSTNVHATFDLTLNVIEEGGQLSAAFEYNTDLFDASTIEAMAGHFGRLLQAIVADPAAPVGALNMLDADERQRILVDWNATAHHWPQGGQSVHQMFEAQAARNPGAAALVVDGATLSYGELDARANRLAHHLRARGVGPDVRVGLCVERSFDMMTGLLAILKAGGAYLPLDPAYPQERLAYMLEDAAPALLLTQQALLERLPAGAVPVVCLDRDAGLLAGLPASALSALARPANLAYVMYTSGSTGKPKGGMIEHAQLANLVCAQAHKLREHQCRSVLQFASLSFDMSVEEIFPALAMGACLVVRPAGMLIPDGEFLALIEAHGIDAVNLPTGFWHEWVSLLNAGQSRLPRSLRLLAVGGERVSAERYRQWARHSQGQAGTWINAYGPTENTVNSTTQEMAFGQACAQADMPIGRPLPNTEAYILDAHCNPVPAGVAGELYVAGAGLTRGYLNRPGLTAEKFVPHPFSAAPGARMYQTGDLARYLADGRIEYLGRGDQQVKLRGFRIELGEIEAALMALPQLREAAVLARQHATGEQRLVGYLVAHEGVAGAALEAAALRLALLRTLPDYMVPAHFMVLDKLPLSPNGKLDRKALPAPDLTARSQQYVAPSSATEIALAAIWAEVLKLDRIGVHDNFFDLGGHSLLATQLMSKLRNAFAVELPLLALFEAGSVDALAQRIDQARQEQSGLRAPAIVPVARGGQLPLSFAQQRLWFLDQFESGSSFYNMPSAARLSGRLDVAAMGRTLNEIVRRHEALRTRFASVDGTPAQVIAPALEVALPLTDLSELPAAEREAKALWLAQDEAQAPFDLAAGPLLRAALIRLAPQEHIIVLTLHHIVSDGWSMGVLVAEIAALYGAYAQGLPSPLPALAIQYADFAHWQREWLSGEVLERQLGYWRAQLAQAPTLLSLPTDRARPAQQSYRGATLAFTVPAAVTAGLHALGRQARGTLFMTLAAAFNVLLSRYAGQSDICIGTPIANRNRGELEPLIGFFVNTLVLRAQVDGDAPFTSLLAQLRATTLDAYAHQDLPFEQLVDAVKPERHASHAPLFQVMLVLDNTPMETLQLPELSLQPVAADTTTAKFDLTLNIVEGGDELFASFEYNTDLFDASTIARMAGHFGRLLEAIVADPASPVGALAMLDGAEQRQLLVQWNDTAQACPQGQAMHQWFEAQAARAPERTALVCDGATLTYAELNGRANRLAHHLRAQGVGPDVLVGICVERSPEMVVGLLAILKAGGAYVPLDPAYPRQRLAYMLEDAAPALLLTQRHLLEQLPASAATVFCLDRDADQLDAYGADNPACVTLPEHLAYVIYTSGSTGQPKGIGIGHRSASAFIDWSLASFDAASLQRVLASTSMCFDLSIFELFVPLSLGGSCWIVRNVLDLVADPSAYPVSLINTVPSAIAELHRAGAIPPSVKVINLAGEALSNALVQTLYRQESIERIFNLYGPSEDTTYSTYTLTEKGAAHSCSIGRPIAHTQAYILDARLQPVPVGVAGELYLSGAGLARGYLNRPELTAEKFLPHPFSATPGARMYRTGDLARYLPDGNIEYLGRIDQQVKLRGFRIELGEIEAALSALPVVREAVVLAREDVAGDKRLVAYLVLAQDHAGEEPDLGALRAELLRTLPEYMIPAHVVLLEQLPLSPNGKLDRKALPAPDMSRGGQDYVAPRTPTEQAVAAIWAEVLKLDRVGVHDNFFELGGHSLLATQLMSKLRGAFAVELPLRTLFEAGSVELLAQRVDQARQEQCGPAAPAIVPVARDGRLPLSFAQQRLWFLDQFESGSSFYNIPAAVRLNGRLDVAAMRGTLNEIVRRHEALRTSFASVDGTPVQVIAPALEVALPLTDLSELPAAEREAKALWLAQDAAQTPFDLAAGPLLRATLIRLAPREHIVVLTLHHIVSDGWSMGVLVAEIAALYGARVQGLPSPLPALAIQYADFAHWQREWLSGEVLERQLGYWRAQLAQAPTLLPLPTDRARPAVQTYHGATLAFTVPAAVTAGLQALGQQVQGTLFMTLAAAFNVLLSRYAGQSDICIGTPIANRNRGELEPLIGFFVNTLVLRAQVDGDMPFTALLAQLRATTLDAYAHQDLPFEQLVDAVKPERHTSHAPLFQVMLSLQNTPMDALELPELSLQPVPSTNVHATFDLTLNVIEEGGQLSAAFEYNTDLFDASTIEAMAGHFGRLLQAIVADPAAPVGALNMLDADERQRILVDWNATAHRWPQGGQSVHQMFEAQAARNPGAAALVVDGATLSYGELDARANRLAHHLRARGVGPDVRVGLCVERSFDMMTGLLAILKAGGAYLPLDPAYPQERLAYMLEDAAPALLLTQQALLERLPAGAVPVVCLDRDAGLLAGLPASALSALARPANLAYVMYTSGSTGKPKGGMIEHAQLANLVCAQAHKLREHQCRSVLQFASLSFDMSVEEIFPALAMGACLVVRPAGMLIPDGEFLALIEAHGIDAVNLPTGFWHEWVSLLNAGQSRLPRSLRLLAVGGERVSAERYRQWARHSQGQAGTWINAYGPTENTVNSTTQEMAFGQACAQADMPIGRPLPNTEAYILDAHCNPVPAGVAGELYVAGAGLTRGYLNRPGLTAEKFVPHPFSAAPGARMYQTGDLARYLADGRIEYLGRGDQQVKLRGFRIELGEIEAALMALPQLREAAVLARQHATGEQRLVGYLVAHEGVAGAALEAAALRLALLRTLPDYMVPAHFMVLDKLPLSPNGKLDRKALPAPDLTARSQQYVAPSTPTEATLAAIWAEVLKLDRIGVHDNFFDLGGHSLLATQLMSKLRNAFAVELPLLALFEAGSVDALAQRIDQARQEQSGLRAPAIVPVARGGQLPLSFAQQRLWFLNQFESGSSFYNMPSAARLSGRLDVAAMGRTLNEIVRRHEALRTRFASVDGTPAQVIAPALEVALPLTDLSELPAAEREAKALWLAQDEAQAPFDLAAGPLLRAALIRLAPQEHIIVLTLHHIVSDGWSMGVLVAEIAALYGAYAQGLPSPLPELAIQYADFAHWQREWLSGEVLERQLGYWRAQLAQAPTLLSLPTDRARPAQQSYRGATLAFTVPAAVTAGLHALGRQARGTLFMTLAAAFNVLLSRYAGQSDICIGTPIANRNRGELEPLIGFFVNTLVLRAQVDGDMPFAALLAQLRATTLDAYAHQDLPFEQLVDAVKPERHASHAPLFQVMLVLDNTPMETLQLPELSLQPVAADTTTAKFDLTLNIVEGGDELFASFEYNTDLFDASTIARMAGHFGRLLEAIVADPVSPVGALAMLDGAEQRQLLVQWNDTAQACPQGQAMHQWFEAQAARAPERTALVCEGATLTYAELNGRANRLAHHLRAQGVGPDVLVGICVERSPEMVVGLLAILKAGGAYVPLDPAYPRQRLAYMLEDAAPALLLTQRHLLEQLPASAATVFCLDRDADQLDAYGADNPACVTLPEHLAYVIYTSGSTGQPKGIGIGHRSASAFIDWSLASFDAASLQRVLASTSMCFDLSIFELFVPLSLGGSCWIVRNVLDLVADPSAYPVSLINTVPSAIAELHRAGAIPPSVKVINLAGEALSNALVQTLYRQESIERIFNLYGPSEDTTYSTYTLTEKGAAHSCSIGRPIAHTQAYILDARLRPVPVGVAGELYLSGAGLARGYLNRPELTAEKFLPHPFSATPGARMYRTGDLARYLPDGNIEYLGRIDQQVKLRGFRIELGEIEAALSALPVVREAVVLAREDVAGDKRLVAYLVLAQDHAGEAPDLGALRGELLRTLPEYMIPAHVVLLEQLPLSPNGKLDRKALPAPDMSRGGQDYVAPRTPTEQAVAAIWAEVLKLDRVGVHDNFFELGGHSLLATQLMSRTAKELQMNLSLKQLFDAPTIAGMADLVKLLQWAKDNADNTRSEEEGREEGIL